MKTYRVLAKPDIRKAIAVRPALGESILSHAIADVIVRELSEDPFGQVTVDVQLERSTHEEALEEIGRVVERCGYALVGATATEWIGAETQRAGMAAAAFLLGTGASENPLVGLAVSAGATLLAEEVGLVVDRMLVEYNASRNLLGEWTLTKLPRTSAAGRQPDVGFSVA